MRTMGLVITLFGVLLMFLGLSGKAGRAYYALSSGQYMPKTGLPTVIETDIDSEEGKKHIEDKTGELPEDMREPPTVGGGGTGGVQM